MEKEKPPNDLKIRWGWTESIVSRNTAKMIFSRKPVQNLRNWVQDVFFPEEFFYATLATMDKAELKKGNVIQGLKFEQIFYYFFKKALIIPISILKL